MWRIIAVILIVAPGVAAIAAQQPVEGHWLRCSLTQDILRDQAGKSTTKPLTGSVIFIIDDANRTFFTFSETDQAFTKLQANVQPREVTWYDGPLVDTLNRVTGVFTVVASPFHEANGSCMPIDPLVTTKPKF
jgi:hypothetical protein